MVRLRDRKMGAQGICISPFLDKDQPVRVLGIKMAIMCDAALFGA